MLSSQAEKVTAALAAYHAGQLRLAFDLYKQLADAGHIESQVFLAWMMSAGVGCSRNEEQAASYYEKAAALGNPTACFYFGRWLTKMGEHTRAFNFYQRGVQAGHLPSMFRVGHSLARGKGVDIDLPRAYAVLKSAAAMGHAFALREIAVLDLRGGRGFLWMPVGLIEFAAAFCWGVAVSMFRKDSDLLRG